jgi:CheY-like chemotaxis protein
MVLFWEGFMPLGWILVVEDNIDNLELVRFLLEKAGHQVYCAYDGLQGLDMARQLHPDLVLLDLTLPAIDGWHVVKTLKADPATQAIKVVALTAHAYLAIVAKRLARAVMSIFQNRSISPILSAISSSISRLKLALQGFPWGLHHRSSQ